MPSRVGSDQRLETRESIRDLARDIIEHIMQDGTLSFGEKLCLIEALLVHDSEAGRTTGLDTTRQAPREPWRGSKQRYHG